jgi:hypothetical protein
MSMLLLPPINNFTVRLTQCVPKNLSTFPRNTFTSGQISLAADCTIHIEISRTSGQALPYALL